MLNSFVCILCMLWVLAVQGDGESKNSFSSTLGHLKPRSSSATQAAAVQELIERIVPTETFWFAVEVDPNLRENEAKDLFQIQKLQSGQIRIKASTGVAAAAGFNHYLKYFCNCHISWEVSQLNLPKELPDVNLTVTFNDRFRYYQNVCTTSYSFVWWDWLQWEKHIDWMALNSFNLVLAFNGQEAIWNRVYQKFNLTTEDIDEHFSGPAFLSWLRMGNIRGWSGPLSRPWHTRSVILQKLILKRMRDLGMIPVLPAFAGHLPRAFKRLYPNVTMVKLGSWNNFNDTYCCPYFLDPTEKLFNEIGKAFIEEQIAEFGTDHVYNCDSFNEMNPLSGDLVYLANVGKSIYKAMADVDPKAIWILQNWMFVNEADFWTKPRAKSILTSVPVGRMIVLDLMSEHRPHYEELDQYFGQPYIWCMLHNFGGTLGMFGSSSIINEKPYTARNLANSTMIGIGLTPEGINQNYVIYELMIETSWRNSSVDLSEWFEDYSARRYGSVNENSKNAWKILQQTVYDYSGDDILMGQYLIAGSPNFAMSRWNWYAFTDLMDSWAYLILASNNFTNNSGYLYDLVDVTRQVLQVTGDLLYNQIVLSYQSRDTYMFNHNSGAFLDMLSDLESILSTNKGFLLGRWLNAAKNASTNSEESKQFENNARNQITLWGPNGEIMDYATKQWSGIVSNYFIPRWKMFLTYANDTLINDKPFDQSYISNKMFTEVELPFTFDRSEFPEEPIGDTIDVAHAIYNKWYPKLIKWYLRRVIISK